MLVVFTVISLMLLELGNLTFDLDFRFHQHFGYSIASILSF